MQQEFDHSPLMSRGTSRDYQSIAEQSSLAGAFSRVASREYVDSIGEPLGCMPGAAADGLDTTARLPALI